MLSCFDCAENLKECEGTGETCRYCESQYELNVLSLWETRVDGVDGDDVPYWSVEGCNPCG